MNQFEKEMTDWTIKAVILLKELTDTEAISHFDSAWEFNDIVNPQGVALFHQAQNLLKDAYKIAGVPYAD